MPQKRTEEKFISCTAAQREWLAMRDGKFAHALSRLEPFKRRTIPDPFAGLVHAITGQQISSKAHASIWAKLEQRLPAISPTCLVSARDDDLRACGLSAPKTRYVKTLAQAFVSGDVDSQQLRNLPDEALAEKLAPYPGIGTWTIEMVLIFTFKRPDVLSYGDLAIQRGLMRLYGLTRLERSFFERCRRLYSPCGTAASLCLWEIAALKDWTCS